MPKKQQVESVFHDWVHCLPFQMQALLATAMRGPDATQKETPAKAIVRYLRGAVMKPAGHWEGANDNSFMWGDYNDFPDHRINFWDDHDEYPHHFLMHLVHCAEVVGYKHPDMKIRKHWLEFYSDACESFHMEPESEGAMDDRLNDFGAGWHNEPM